MQILHLRAIISFVFVALTAGTVVAGWLSDRFQRRKAMLISSALINIPATWLMGQVSELWQLVALTVIVFFFIGMTFTSINVLAGLFASEAERGKVFGILAINTGLGAVIGAALSGRIVDAWGYPALFLAAAACWLLQPLLTLLLQDKVVSRDATTTTRTAAPDKAALGGMFYVLLAANLIAFAANFTALLARPLLMSRLGFEATAIASVGAIGGLISLPFPVFFGWLSDRMNRYWLVALCFAFSAIGLLMLASATVEWQFWASAILLSGTGISLGIGPALVTDVVPAQALGKGLSWYGFSSSAGGIVGFTLTGYAIQGFGMNATFIGSALLTVMAILLVLQVRRARQLQPVLI
ncbi:MAG: MFS transporter [Anaerolineae bacterium]